MLPMKIIYADNNATTPVAPEVYEAMTPFFTEDYFNPSSMYEPARRTAGAMTQARKQIADYFHVGDPKQFLFTSCARRATTRRFWRGEGQSPAPPHHHHGGRTPRRARSVQGPSARRL